MEIVNPKVIEDLKNNKPLKLDLGSGVKTKDGFYSIDHIALEGIDVIADLNQPLILFPDNCVEYVFSRHTFEHIENLLQLMREIHRITRKNGTIEIVVPHFSNIYGFSDPTHVRYFGLYTMYYFVANANQPDNRQVPDYYIKEKFVIENIRIEFYDHGFLDKLIRPLLTRLVNINITYQDFYERRISNLFHAHQIRYIMHPDK